MASGIINLIDSPEDTFIPYFKPALWRQRREKIWEILRKEEIKSLLELGCGSGAILSSLIPCMDMPPLIKLTGLDINDNALAECVENCKPWPNDFKFLRERPLEVSIYKGSLEHPSEILAHHECILMSEVIEHLDSHVLKVVPKVLFGYYQPKLVIISTPNADFNVLFPNLKYKTPEAIFRDKDHRFEWTKAEFETWCKFNASQFGYTVTFDGVGLPKDKEDYHLGFCTQFAVFKIKESYSLSKLISDKSYSPIQLSHIHFPHFPFDPPPSKSDLINNLNRYAQYMRPVEESNNWAKIRIDDMWNVLEIRQFNRTKASFIEFLNSISNDLVKMDKKNKNVFWWKIQ